MTDKRGRELIYIVASLKKEIEDILLLSSKIKKYRDKRTVYYRLVLNSKEVVVVKSGIGKRQLNEDYFKDCTLFISTGFCGALVPDLKTGDIVVSSCIYTMNSDDYMSYIKGSRGREKIEVLNEKINIDKIPIDELQDNLGDGIRIETAPTFTSPRVVKNRREKLKLNELTGALAVDMEDWYRYQFAKKLGCDFISVRSVLDEVTDDVPGFTDGLKIGQKIAGIVSKIGHSQQAIAVAVDTLIKLY